MCDAVLKKQLRKKCLEQRDKLANRQRLSLEISKKLQEIPEYKRAENILCYASFGSEVDTADIMSEILDSNKRLYLPRCDEKTHTMQAVRVKDLSTLKKGAYGILEPLGEETEPQKIDLVIVPLVGFDRTLARLGYGGGYYDRFLTKTSAKRIAIAFSIQETEKIPQEDTDILMDMTVTEKEVIKGAF